MNNNNSVSRNTKRFTQGSHRTCSPQQTLAKAKGHMAAMGITRIANVTGLDNIGIDVVTVCRPQSKAISVAQGKGHNLDAAKASGLMEAIETYHGEYISLPVRIASFNELKSQYLVADVRQLPSLTISKFHDELTTLWIAGEDIISNQTCYV
ncbi:MAG: YcaO-like family protein, partial [Algicola sp.]|nr:YcaO-like family protein [Algicola sp.]